MIDLLTALVALPWDLVQFPVPIPDGFLPPPAPRDLFLSSLIVLIAVMVLGWWPFDSHEETL